MSARKEVSDRRRPRTISISPNEWALLVAAADGGSVSDFIRRAALARARVVKKEHPQESSTE
jgi:uncharacterized protein (DUF1778 family)